MFWVVSFEYLGVGLGTAAFVAFIARATNPRFTATQFALLTSVTAIPRTVANSTTGFLVESLGWTHFFMLCLVVALPGMALLWWVAPWSGAPRGLVPKPSVPVDEPVASAGVDGSISGD